MSDPWPAVKAWQAAHQESVIAYAVWAAACDAPGKPDAVDARLRLQAAIDAETEAEKDLAALRASVPQGSDPRIDHAIRYLEHFVTYRPGEWGAPQREKAESCLSLLVAALRAGPPGEPPACNCEFSDAWRCAVARRLTSVACHCLCHRGPSGGAATP